MKIDKDEEERAILIYSKGVQTAHQTLASSTAINGRSFTCHYANGIICGAIRWIVKSSPNETGLKFALWLIEQLPALAREAAAEKKSEGKIDVDNDFRI